jgi:hypothetical protein
MPQHWQALMTGDQSRGLKVGERVCRNADQNDQGSVTEKNWAGVTIKWDNRSEEAILHNDMRRLSGCEPKTTQQDIK